MVWPVKHEEVGVMAPERWRLLLATAAREFAAVGYEQASLNRIIRACGMSKSSFYHYVRSKQELFETVVEHIARSLARELVIPAPEEFADADFWSTADQMFQRLLALARREPLFTDLGRMCYLPGAPAGEDSAVGATLTAIEDWIERTLAAGRSVGAIRDDLPAALQRQITIAVLRAFDEWMVRHQAELDEVAVDRLARAQFDAVNRLLAPNSHSRPRAGNQAQEGQA